MLVVRKLELPSHWGGASNGEMSSPLTQEAHWWKQAEQQPTGLALCHLTLQNPPECWAGSHLPENNITTLSATVHLAQLFIQMYYIRLTK